MYKWRLWIKLASGQTVTHYYDADWESEARSYAQALGEVLSVQRA